MSIVVRRLVWYGAFFSLLVPFMIFSSRRALADPTVALQWNKHLLLAIGIDTARPTIRLDGLPAEAGLVEVRQYSALPVNRGVRRSRSLATNLKG